MALAATPVALEGAGAGSCCGAPRHAAGRPPRSASHTNIPQSVPVVDVDLVFRVPMRLTELCQGAAAALAATPASPRVLGCWLLLRRAAQLSAWLTL